MLNLMQSTAAAGKLSHPTAVTIAGFDPGSGAGISADLLTFSRFGIFATAAITALTVQSTRGVRRVQAVDPVLLRDTLAELEDDLPGSGCKIGMLGGAAQVHVVAEFLRTVRARRAITVVLDPVLVSSSGAVLLDQPGLEVLREDLLPLTDALTPNAPEAALLTGLSCRNVHEAEECGAALAQRYPRTVAVITGGHLEPPCDLVWQRGTPTWIPGERIDSLSTHGTGCVFSSALLASKLRGSDWAASAAAAKSFVTDAIRTATARGSGHGPTHLLGGNLGHRSS